MTDSAVALELPTGIEGAIFDCDGTLADTMPLHYRAWSETLALSNAEMAETLFYELGGVASEEIVRILNARHGYHLPVQETAAAKEARYEELLPQALAVRPVVALVRTLYGRIPLAVASGGIRRLVDKTVAALDLTSCFAAVKTAEDVINGKPAPDLFLAAAAAIDVAPERCIVYEDSDLGLEAARRAGMAWVDVRPLVQEGRTGEVLAPEEGRDRPQ